MAKIQTSCIILVIILLVMGCGKSQRELAVGKINQAKAIIANGDTLQGIEMLESVIGLYPDATVQIGVAKNMTSELYRLLIDDRIAQSTALDSAIVLLEKNFKKEKNEFDIYAQYIPKRQSFNRSWDRSFLQVNLDERGELFLSSNYMGKEWLNHTSIRVYDAGLQAKTDEVSLEDADNHRSDFLQYKWERVSYRNGKSDSVIQFIANNPTLKIKCVYIGKQHYYILLEDYDVQAVTDALALSNAIKMKKALEEEIKGLREKLN